MTETVSAANAKSRFSELVNRTSNGRERFLIERKGKSVGAIVSEEPDAILAEIWRERQMAADWERQ